MRVLVPFALLLVACGGAPAPSAPPSPPSSPTPPPVTSAEPAPASKRRPFPITNNCSDVATMVIGEDPKGPGKTIAPFASLEIPRSSSGQDTVWLLDSKSEPLVKVVVTKGMKQVEIGRSCRTLDAR